MTRFELAGASVRDGELGSQSGVLLSQPLVVIQRCSEP
jgi:hypothetical protein